MKWDKKDQAIFECADKGLLGLKRFGWLTLQEYEFINMKISDAIKDKEALPLIADKSKSAKIDITENIVAD